MATITVSEETAARLRAAAEGQGIDAEELLLSLLDKAQTDEIEAIRVGIAASDAGRVRPATEWLNDHKKRYPDPAETIPGNGAKAG